MTEFFRKASRTPAYPSTQIPRFSPLRMIRRHPVRSASIAGAALLGAALVTLALPPQTPAEIALSQEVEEIVAVEAVDAELPAQEVVESEVAALASAPRPTVEKATRIALLEPTDTAPGLPDEARWSSAGTMQPSRTAARELAELLGEQHERATDVDAFAQAFDLEPDRNATTAAIDAMDAGDARRGDVVAIAESDIEVAALESRLANENRDVFALADGDAAASGPIGQGTVTSHVNMRAAPENDAQILKVLPQSASVSVVDDCPNWCEVEHEGVRGFVYGSFVDRQAPSTVSSAEGLQ